MDQQNHGQPPFNSAAPISYGMNQYQPNQISGGPVGSSSNMSQSGGLPASASQLSQNHLAYQQVHQQQQQQLQEQLNNFWANQHQEIERVTDFKNHNLPLARIKKIMKADEDVRMISAEAPVLFARACEMFILELTMRSWSHTEENKRRTLQKNDIAAAITRTDIFDFLVDIVPRDDMKDEALSPVSRSGNVGFEGPAEGHPYYYMPPPSHPSQLTVPGSSMGNPIMDQASTAYVQQPHPYAVPQMWPQHQQQPPPES